MFMVQIHFTQKNTPKLSLLTLGLSLLPPCHIDCIVLAPIFWYPHLPPYPLIILTSIVHHFPRHSHVHLEASLLLLVNALK